jgi:hypothetical protein
MDDDQFYWGEMVISNKELLVILVMLIIMFVMVEVVMLVMVVVVVVMMFVMMMFVMMMARTVGQFCKTEEAASRCGSACLKAECQPHYHDDDAENAKKYAENMMMVIFIIIMMRTVIHHIQNWIADCKIALICFLTWGENGKRLMVETCTVEQKWIDDDY